MNNFKYSEFYNQLTKSKKNQNIFDIIINCKGYNTKSKTLTISHGVNQPDDVKKAFHDCLYNVREYKALNLIHNGSYLKVLNKKIDLVPICLARKKFHSSDKNRNAELNKSIRNFQSLEIYFIINFMKEKNKFLTHFKLEQLDEEGRYYDDPFKVDFIFLKKFKNKIDTKSLDEIFNNLLTNSNDEIILANNGELVPLTDLEPKMKEFEIFNWNEQSIKKTIKNHKIKKLKLINSKRDHIWGHLIN